ncbi:hypothetical protein D7030_00070 [Flavobacteriaceae bacterium AU392]|nr:hypothetical protein D1817_14365 [Flavobacteriaceae bacterium]RKM86929.1 hypothetical protein D7030_00070 [Flavobacteriaceae bacterium AU392]
MYTYKKLSFFTISILVLTSILSCTNTSKKNDDIKDEQINTVITITSKDVETLEYIDYAFSNAASSVISNWAKFTELENHIQSITTGNLSVFKDIDSKTIISSLFADLRNEIPLALKTTPILVRITVLETFFLKIEDLIKYEHSKGDLLNDIKEILVARSNIILLINKKVENDSQNITKPSF